MEIEIKYILENGAVLPEYKTSGAAGADLCAFLPNGAVQIEPNSRAIIPTGIKIEIPCGFEAQIRSRSGLAAKNGVFVLNSPGTIDSDYRGEIKVILQNLGSEKFSVQNGDRIAQIVFAPVTKGVFAKAQNLSESARGESGFGSTGRA